MYKTICKRLIASSMLFLLIGQYVPAYAAPLIITTSNIVDLEQIRHYPLLGNSGAGSPYITPDGKYISYTSNADNITIGDINPGTDNFRFDTTTSENIITSKDGLGNQIPWIYNSPRLSILSSDGQTAILSVCSPGMIPTDTNGACDLYIKNIQTEAVERINTWNGLEPDGSSFDPSISNDGQYITFDSTASNLIPIDTSGTGQDVFLYDRTANTIEIISKNISGVQGDNSSYSARISGNGRYIVFTSGATNLVSEPDANGLQTDIYIYDRSLSTMERISVNSAGVQGNFDSWNPTISDDGRFVAFSSNSTNFDPLHTSNTIDNIYIRDRQLGTTTLVTKGIGNTPSTSWSWFPEISRDGSTIVFQSIADNLVSGDTNGVEDIFSYDIATQTITGITTFRATGGSAFEPKVNGDGTKIVFWSESDTYPTYHYDGQWDLFMFDTLTNTFTIINQNTTDGGVDDSMISPSISRDGNKVAFATYSSGFDQDKPEQWMQDTYLYDRNTNTASRISKTPGGAGANADSDNVVISADGTKAAYESQATDIVSPNLNSNKTHIFFYNEATDSNELVSQSSTNDIGDGDSFEPSINEDGSMVTFYSNASNLVGGDGNGAYDIFLRHTTSSTTERISVPVGGGEANNSSWSPFISPNGRFVVFESDASNLVPGDINGVRDIFLLDRDTNSLSLVSTDSSGALANGDSYYPKVSNDGTFVVFESVASNLVAGDTNSMSDIFLKNIATGTVTKISSAAGGDADGNSTYAFISENGKKVSFSSEATNLVAGDTNGVNDIFVYDTDFGTLSIATASLSGTTSNQDTSNQRSALSANGSQLIYMTRANNLVPRDLSCSWCTRMNIATLEHVDVRFAYKLWNTNESNGSANLEVIVSGGILSTSREVTISITGGTATNGSDFTMTSPYVLTIPAGNYITPSTITVPLTIINDGSGDPDETIEWTFENPDMDISIIEPLNESDSIIPMGIGSPVYTSTLTLHEVNTAPLAPTGIFTNTQASTAQTGSTNPTNLSSTTLVTSALFQDNDAGDTASKYAIEVATDNTFTTPVFATSLTGTALTSPVAVGNRSEDLPLTGFTPISDTTYYLRVKFWDNAGEEGAFSTPNTFKYVAPVVNTAPLAPTGIFTNTQANTAQTGSTNPTNLSSTTLVTSALFQDSDAGDTASKYAIEVATDSTFTTPVFATSLTGTDLTTPVTVGNRSEDLPLTGFTPVSDTTYYLRVKFWDNAGIEGAFSAPSTFKYVHITPTPLPPAVYGGSGGGYTSNFSERSSSNENTNHALNLSNRNTNTQVQSNSNTHASSHSTSNSSQSITPVVSDYQRPTDTSTPVGRYNIPFKETVCAPMKAQDTTIADTISQEDLKIFVENLLKKGVAFQKEGETFDPASSVNRSEMLRYIIQGNCEDFRHLDAFPAPFPDVAITHQDALFIYLAKMRNIVRGYLHDGTFKPDTSISRAEALKVILEMTLSDGTMKFDGNAQPFTDVAWDDANTWYKNYLSFAVEKGIVTVPESKLFRPADPALKSEIIFLLARSLQVKAL